MCYTNQRFTYLLTYLLTVISISCLCFAEPQDMSGSSGFQRGFGMMQAPVPPPGVWYVRMYTQLINFKK